MIKKKFFLFLTIIATILCIVGCTDDTNGVVRLNFTSNSYEVRMHEELELKPLIKVSAGLNRNDIEVVYESEDETIARYVDGVVIPVSMGTTKIKAYYSANENVFTTATVTVKKAKIATIEIEESIQLLKGAKQQIAYELVNNYSETKAVFSAVENDVLTVTEEGVVHAEELGEAYVRVVVSDAEESYERLISVKVVESDFAISYDTDGGVLPEGAAEGYSALELPTLLPVPTKVGYEFKGWMLGEEVVTELPASTYGDVVVKAVWEAVNYEIKYSDEAEGNPATYTIEDEVELKAASKVGYEFKGWTLNGVEVEKIEKGTTGDLELLANFEVITYTISYSEEVEGNPTTYTVEDEVVLVGPSKTGYEYKGWVLNEKVVTKIAKGTTGDLELVPSFEAIKYAITYSDAVEGNPATYTIEDEVELKAPSKEGYDFVGWISNGEVITKIEKGTTGALDLVAKFEKSSLPITYVLNGGSLSSDAIKEVKPNNSLELVAPTRYNHTFAGWYTDEKFKSDVVTKVDNVTEAMTFYAKWYVGKNISIDAFTAEFLADWNKYSVEQATVENFQTTTVTGIKNALSNVEMLTKYKWLLEYELASLTEANQDKLDDEIFTDTKTVLEGLIAGDTEIISGGTHAWGRTLIRHWLHGLMNKELPNQNATCKPYSVDFSDAENQDSFLEAYSAYKFSVEPVFDITYDDVVNAVLADFGLKKSFSVWVSNVDDLFRANFEKWSGLLDYFIAVRPNDKFTDTITSLKGGADLTGSVDPYVITGELSAFVNKKTVTYSTPGIVSADYGKEEIRNRIWEFISQDSIVVKAGYLSYELNGGEMNETPTTIYKVGSAVELPVPTKREYVFLGWSLTEDATEYFTVLPTDITDENTKLYANWKFDALYVGEGLDYETISDALKDAVAGDYIIVAAGNYEEDLVINKDGIIILGANSGIAYNGERSDETIVKSITIKGDSVVVDGIQFASFQAVKVDGGNYVTIKNSIMHATPSNESTYVIEILDNCTGFTLLDSSIKETDALYQTRAIHAQSGKSTDFIISGNYFGNSLKAPSSTVYIDCIRLYSVGGTISIENNIIEWPGDNFTLFFGSTSVDKNTVFNINNNVFTSERTSSGVSMRNVSEGSIVNIIGNSFTKVGGTVLQAYGTGTGDTTSEFTVNILNNAFNDTSTKISLGFDINNLNMNNNYSFQDIVWANSQGTSNNPAENAENALNGVVSHKVTFEVGIGHLYGAPTSFVEGTSLSLSNVIPSGIGLQFLGWYANEDYSGDAVTVIGSQTEDVTLYAKWKELETYEVTYELGKDNVVVSNLVTSAYEGTVLELPTPTLFGWTFLGWSLVKDSEDYVTSITLTANITLFANWSSEEVIEVTLVLNGGNFTYKDLAAVKKDFNTDYVNLTGQTNYSEWKCMAALGKVFTDSNHKWDWLLEYWAGVNTNSYGENTNASVFLQMRDKGTCPEYYFYGVEITSWYGSTQKSVYGGALKSADYSDYSIQDAWWSYYSAHEENVKEFVNKYVLPTNMYNSETLQFAGWYTNPEFTGEPVTEVREATTVYAKWIERTPVDSITIENEITTINKFNTHQLQWTINPSDAYIKSVQITSSNPSVATVTATGLITAVANGTTTITIKSKSSSGAAASFELTVVTPDYFEASYETESYVEVDGEIKLNAQYVSGDTKKSVLWKSLNTDLATVSSEGIVCGKGEGLATIRAYIEGDEDAYLDFYVTVVSAEVSDAIKLILENHESNVFVKYDLPIGYPTSNQGYYKDIFGSVSNIFYNHELEIDESMLENGNATGSYYTNSVKKEGLEFITVHYTGTFNTGADTDNIATNFTKQGTSVSIHYVTGNHGVDSSGNETAEVFHTLSHDHGAYHAGDSSSRYYSNSTLKNASGDKIFTWMPTGVAYDGCDLLDVKFTATKDFYYEINGQKTEIKLPSTWNYDSRNSNHIYDYSTGLISSQSNFLSKFTWGSTFENRTPESFFNSQDFPITVINGEYYMGPTWWCFDQVLEGRICGTGGNRNSIGIESCVNEGSDVWYTWQVTAQLVAKLMYDNNLGIERVKGHHFFSGKDCPQPLLENDMEIWYKFIDMVQAEYELITTYKDYDLTFKSNNTDIISENGRVISNPADATSVTYTVTVKVGDKTETITLASMVPSLYNK